MSWRDRGRALALSLLGLVLFALALAALRRELGHVSAAELGASLRAIPPGRIALALGFTALSYLALGGYDALSSRLLGIPLAPRRSLLAGFLGFVASHNLGAMLGGAAMRFRIYASFGIGAADVARIVALDAATFWLGFLALCAAMLTLVPAALPSLFAAAAPHTLALTGALAALVLAYVFAGRLRGGRPLRARDLELMLPTPAGAFAQVGLGALDWLLAAAALFALLPPSAGVPFTTVLVAFLLSAVFGVVSHVPGGVGVFEGAMISLLAGRIAPAALFGPLLVYRFAYYLLPLVVGGVVLGTHELIASRASLERAGRVAARWAPDVVPTIFAVLSFGAGTILLFSGATPAETTRFARLREGMPLALLEVSHLLGSVVGMLLLLVARGLQRRLDAAWWIACGGLAAGIGLSLAKGADWEEALALALVIALLLPARRLFYRRASLLAEPLSTGFVVAILLVVQATIFLVLLAYRHVEYGHELWWQFELDAHAPRSMRAAVAGVLVLLVWAVRRLLRPAPPEAPLPGPDEIDRAAAIVARASEASAHLALLGDKSLLFHESGDGFLMYAAAGRSLVAMGDPVGPPAAARELVWSFRELAEETAHQPVFYEVRPANLPLYLDLGLTLTKLGEQARVPLAHFSLEGSARKALRYAKRRVEREGGSFEMVDPAGVPPLLDELEAVSRAWLADKRTREKGFSLGFFERAYLARLPIGVVRQKGRIVAFANLWPGGSHHEISIDLMRHLADAPPGVMEYLFAELMGWGREQGYAWFDLGMAPLSGLESRALAPLWSRLGAGVYRHGERFYNFRGLRAYKEKFDPIWEPRYLASPGGLALPSVLASVASLISRGLAGTVRR